MSQKPYIQTSPYSLCALLVAMTQFSIWQHCNTLCINDFVDEFMFAHNYLGKGVKCSESSGRQHGFDTTVYVQADE